jgi:hypothetical protein
LLKKLGDYDMSGKFFVCPEMSSPPPLANNFGEKILIRDCNVVGKCYTTPPSPFFILFNGPA